MATLGNVFEFQIRGGRMTLIPEEKIRNKAEKTMPKNIKYSKKVTKKKKVKGGIDFESSQNIFGGDDNSNDSEIFEGEVERYNYEIDGEAESGSETYMPEELEDKMEEIESGSDSEGSSADESEDNYNASMFGNLAVLFSEPITGGKKKLPGVGTLA